MIPKAIHQFHDGSAYGDGITNGMQFIRQILRDSGFESEIFCHSIDPVLSYTIKPLEQFIDDPRVLLLVHHSLGHHRESWLMNLKAQKILIYHNITPPEYFPHNTFLRDLAYLGYKQLARWARTHQFVGAIADSEFNANELRQFGYSPLTAIPLLVDLDLVRRNLSKVPSPINIDNIHNILFVGRVCENKGQLELIQTLPFLKQGNRKICLHLVGNHFSSDYVKIIIDEIRSLGLGDNVRLLGKINDNELYALYKLADAYVSLSHHEGFGMPLIEAMASDLPIIATEGGAVGETLGTGGLLLSGRDPITTASAIRLVLEEPSLRTSLLISQGQVLEKYEKQTLVAKFEAFFKELGFEVELKYDQTMKRRKPGWRIEGPFDSSYSLATVNRNLAKSLFNQGESVCLQSRDGPGIYAADNEILRRDHEVASMYKSNRTHETPSISIRNQYPPYVSDQKGLFRVLGSYGWEETTFPLRYVQALNARCNLITVTSEFVRKVLRDNGVRCPISVVGNGVDHQWKEIGLVEKCFYPSVMHDAEDQNDRSTIFLHVSTGLPRKGIDALLAAWKIAFNSTHKVKLIVKTVPNLHNNTKIQIEELLLGDGNLAPVEHLEHELSQNTLLELYEKCDVVVAPSRGEGFGLPIAEAMALGKAVITTAFGGQRAFCDHHNAWLCDFEFAYAQSHLCLNDSVWVEPNIDSLVICLREAAFLPDLRVEKGKAAQALMQSNFKWENIAKATQNAVGVVRESGLAPLHIPIVGWVSSWNTKCGIAVYSAALSQALLPAHLRVFASRSSFIDGHDPLFVQRCWNAGWEDQLNELFDAIIDSKVHCVVVQFNFGFYRLEFLSNLIMKLQDRKISVYMVLHSTQDVNRPDVKISLSEMKDSLNVCQRVIVHSVADMNKLKTIGITHNVTLFPHGLPPLEPYYDVPDFLTPNIRSKRIIACFGFLLPHKGIRELVTAFAKLAGRDQHLHLLLLNAIYPIADSDRLAEQVVADIKLLNIHDRVTFVTNYLSEQEIASALSCCELIVFPYQSTQESSSAAVRMGLASLKTVVCTPLAIFDDVKQVTLTLPGFTANDIAAGLLCFLDAGGVREALLPRQQMWVEDHSWLLIAERFANLIRGERIDELILQGLD